MPTQRPMDISAIVRDNEDILAAARVAQEMPIEALIEVLQNIHDIARDAHQAATTAWYQCGELSRGAR